VAGKEKNPGAFFEIKVSGQQNRRDFAGPVAARLETQP
jgi:hypothetical protein